MRDVTEPWQRGSNSVYLLGPLAAGERRWPKSDGRPRWNFSCVVETHVRRVYSVFLDAGVDMTCMQQNCLT